MCDINPRGWSGQNRFGEKVKLFDNAEDMFSSGTVDGAIITPHYDHPPLAIAALQVTSCLV